MDFLFLFFSSFLTNKQKLQTINPNRQSVAFVFRCCSSSPGSSEGFLRWRESAGASSLFFHRHGFYIIERIYWLSQLMDG